MHSSVSVAVSTLSTAVAQLQGSSQGNGHPGEGDNIPLIMFLSQGGKKWCRLINTDFTVKANSLLNSRLQLWGRND